MLRNRCIEIEEGISGKPKNVDTADSKNKVVDEEIEESKDGS